VGKKMRDLKERFVELFDVLDDMEDSGMIDKFICVENDSASWTTCINGELVKLTGRTVNITLFFSEE
jgi:hypothetical protein